MTFDETFKLVLQHSKPVRIYSLYDMLHTSLITWHAQPFTQHKTKIIAASPMGYLFWGCRDIPGVIEAYDYTRSWVVERGGNLDAWHQELTILHYVRVLSALTPFIER